MNRTTWIIFITICVVGLGALVFISRGEDVDVGDVEQQQVQQPNANANPIGDRVYGDPNAKVKIIEYGDYQCPGCASAAPAMRQIVGDYKDKDVALIFRNFPLPSLHPNARAAAAAAESAGVQGKFWEMHDKLYATQSEWSELNSTERTDIFTGYAVALGLDSEKFQADMTSDEVTAKINYDIALGKKLNITGTPTILVNNRVIDEYVLDGKLVPEGTESGQPVWGEPVKFEELVLLPELKKAGVSIK